MALYEFQGKRPEIGEGSYVHPQASVIGDVIIGKKCFIGACAVLRGDFGAIRIGDGSNVQENAVLHATPLKPVIVGDDVIVAHGVLIHDAVIGNGAVLSMGAILLHGVVVEEHAVVGAGAVVTPGFVVPARKIVMGAPAKVVKDVSDDAIAVTRMGLEMYQDLPRQYMAGLKRLD